MKANSKVTQIELDRFNSTRKIVNLRGGIEKAHRAYNRQASPVAFDTFKRYMSPGSGGKKAIDFIINEY